MQEVIAAPDAAGIHFYGPIGRRLLAVCRWASILGGIVLVGLVAMSIVSIIGRKLISEPVPGDVEVLQMLAAVSLACFFAYCHLTNNDVRVDFFTTHLPLRAQHFLDGIGSLLVCIFGALISWRAFAGAMSVREVGETSAILGWPVWVAQILMVPGFVLLALAGLYMAMRRLAVALGVMR